MKLKETAICFACRPLAASPAMDFNADLKGNYIDEDIAIRLGFKIRNLHYAHLSLLPRDPSKRTRSTGSIKASIQAIKEGKPGHTAVSYTHLTLPTKRIV